MSHVMKLSLAVGLALADSALNAVWLSATKHPPNFTAPAPTCRPAKRSPTKCSPSARARRLRQARESLIPYENRAILFGLTASRKYVAGDMFFQRDIKAPLELAQFEVLGPFKLISVGSAIHAGQRQTRRSQLDSSGNNITIAVNANFDERTRRLLQIIDPSQDANRDKATCIVAVQVDPKRGASAPPPDDKNVVYQTVQLEGIANVPRVLLAGDVIRFVIPAHDSL